MNKLIVALLVIVALNVQAHHHCRFFPWHFASFVANTLIFSTYCIQAQHVNEIQTMSFYISPSVVVTPQSTPQSTTSIIIQQTTPLQPTVIYPVQPPTYICKPRRSYYVPYSHWHRIPQLPVHYHPRLYDRNVDVPRHPGRLKRGGPRH